MDKQGVPRHEGDKDRTTPGYTPGPNEGGYHAGGVNAASLGGGGAGGDIDRPDITGRGTTKDLTRDRNKKKKQ